MRGSNLVRGAAVLGMAVLAEVLSYGVDAGLNVPVWFGALALVLLATRTRRLDGATRAVALGVFGLVGALVIEPGPLTVLMTLAGTATLAMWVRMGADTEVSQWLGKLIAFGTSAWRVPFRMVRPAARIAGAVRADGVKRAAANWFLPVALSCVFVHLFCIANPVLARMVDAFESAFGGLFGSLFREGPFRWIFSIAAAGGTVLCLRFRSRGWFAGVEDDRLSFRPDLLATETVVRCLVMFNAVFALQTVVDLGVIATGGGLPAGMTFAEYAHRGAYPLIATALLAGVFVTLTFSSGQKAAEQRGARGLVMVWIAQNLVLLASTVYRHALYVDAYGLSRWRIATVVWLGMVALGFVFTAQRILTGRTNGWLLRANVALVVGVLYASCFVNWNGIIAGYNAGHCAERGGRGPSLDISYLVRLGPAALPALEAHRAALDGKRGNYRLADVEDAIAELRARALFLRSDWRSWSFRSMLVTGAR